MKLEVSVSRILIYLQDISLEQRWPSQCDGTDIELSEQELAKTLFYIFIHASNNGLTFHILDELLMKFHQP